MLRKYITIGLLILSGFVENANAQFPLYTETYRPRFHFSPEKNWMNDPNGLVFYDGEYHLFYQYNPFGIRWGHMSWGHAVSHDLVKWEHLPLALAEENKVMVFSGSAVSDSGNTSGFAKESGQIPLVAAYTGHYIADSTKPDNYLQSQYMAWSLDRGRTWSRYNKNPVLDRGLKDFRDPKVFWYAPGKQWIMLLVLPQQHIVQFYGSPNLKDWTHLSDFGPAGDINDIWECPDLLEVPVSGSSGLKKWVLINSQQTTMQYFVGSFDGKRFVSENPPDRIYRPDYGPDYYAGVTYNGLPGNYPPVLLGWANNWKYGQDIPTYPWRSAMALPRELSLRKTGDEWILVQSPVSVLEYSRVSPQNWQDLPVSGMMVIPVLGQQWEMELEFEPASTGSTGLRLAIGDTAYFELGYQADRKLLYLDRSKSRNRSFHPAYLAMSRYETPLLPENGKIRLRVFFDHSLVEVFANGGIKVMTAQVFPGKNDNGIALFCEKEEINFTKLSFWNIRSAWE